MKCPKCKTENSNKSKYCANCGEKLIPTGEVNPSPTQTLFTVFRDLSIGSTFADRYQVIEELGLGGMGRVYKVLDKTVDEKVALKLLNPDIAAQPQTIERFRNELKLARKISHRHVCRMYDLSESEGMPFITMEYISGEDLKSLIRRAGQISVGKALNLTQQILEGLDEAHRRGVVHRDLKPQNIMVDMDGNAKITDFGIARSIKTKGLTGTGIIIGTPEYMSPEQVEGKPVDQRSDLYSLGIILYELVTGKLPFEGDTPLSVAVKHKIEEPRAPQDINAHIPRDLNRVILKCMAKDRKQRYQNAAELLSDLKKIEEGVPTTEKFVPLKKTQTSKQFTLTLEPKKILTPALAVLAAAVLIFALIKIIPQKKFVDRGDSKPSLAVMYFQNNTGEEALDHWRKALSDLLISDLSQSKYLRVLSGEKLYNILEKMNLLEANSYSSDNLKEVAQRGEVSNVLVGQYALAGDTFRISIMLQNAQTGETLGSDSVQGEGAESIFDMVDDLTTKIKSDFQLTVAEIAADIDKAANTLSTSSPEAFRYYSEGIKFFNKGDYTNSIAMMEMAAGLDSEFAMAYLTLSVAYKNLGYGSEAKDRLQRAYDLSEGVSDKERFLIQGQFFAQSEGTYTEAISAYNNLLALFPTDEIGNANLGMIYADLEEWDKAIEVLKINQRVKDNSVQPYLTLSSAYSQMGQHKKANEVFKSYLNDVEDNASIHYSLAQNYISQGELELADEEAKKIFTLDPSHYRNALLKGDLAFYRGDLPEVESEYLKLLETAEPAVHHMGFMRLALFNLQQGKFSDAEDYFQQGIELSEMLDEKGQQAWYQTNLAYLFLRSKNFVQALDECTKGLEKAVEAEDFERQRRLLHIKGIIQVAMNSLDEAERTAKELKTLIDSGMKENAVRYFNHLMGKIEEAKGNLPSAIEFFENAVSLLPAGDGAAEWGGMLLYSLASAYQKSGDFSQARKEYEKIIEETTGRLYCGDVFAFSFYNLGIVELEEGNNQLALEYFKRYLDLFGNSDQAFSEISNAREQIK
ncbi:MAG: protein kinase [Candidatus Aminicenantes bacterium]|nr:protein kinase [Candidatus Aminicenantes bacterium]